MKILYNLNNINVKQTIKRENSINHNFFDNNEHSFCRHNKVDNTSQKIQFHSIYMKTLSFGKIQQSILAKLNLFKDEKSLPETKEAYSKYLKSLKDKNGRPRFTDDSFISSLVKEVIKKNINIFFVKDLADLTTQKGDPVFDGYGISKVLPYVDSENIKYMKNLAGMTTEFGWPLFEDNDYKNLLPVINSENIPIIKDFADLDAKKGVFLNFNWDIPIILPAINAKNINPVKELVNMAVQGGETRLTGHIVRDIAEIIKDDSTFKKLNRKVKDQRNLELKTPEKYVKESSNSKEKMNEDINNFFDKNILSLIKTAYVFDKKTFDKLMSLKLDNASKYMEAIKMFNAEELKILKILCDSKNVYDESLKSNQKIELIDLLYAYKQSDIPLFKIQSMIRSGKVNIEDLNNDLLNQIIENCQKEYNQILKIPSKKISSWEEKAHLFTKKMEEQIQHLSINGKK